MTGPQLAGPGNSCRPRARARIRGRGRGAAARRAHRDTRPCCADRQRAYDCTREELGHEACCRGRLSCRFRARSAWTTPDRVERRRTLGGRLADVATRALHDRAAFQRVSGRGVEVAARRGAGRPRRARASGDAARRERAGGCAPAARSRRGRPCAGADRATPRVACAPGHTSRARDGAGIDRGQSGKCDGVVAGSPGGSLEGEERSSGRGRVSSKSRPAPANARNRRLSLPPYAARLDDRTRRHPGGRGPEASPADVPDQAMSAGARSRSSEARASRETPRCPPGASAATEFRT